MEGYWSSIAPAFYWTFIQVAIRFCPSNDQQVNDFCAFFSIFGSVIWACIPLITVEAHLATAYGIMSSFQNTAQCLIPLILSFLYTKYNNTYMHCEEFLIIMSLYSLFVVGVLWYVDETIGRGVLRRVDFIPPMPSSSTREVMP